LWLHIHRWTSKWCDQASIATRTIEAYSCSLFMLADACPPLRLTLTVNLLQCAIPDHRMNYPSWLLMVSIRRKSRTPQPAECLASLLKSDVSGIRNAQSTAVSPASELPGRCFQDKTFPCVAGDSIPHGQPLRATAAQGCSVHNQFIVASDAKIRHLWCVHQCGKSWVFLFRSPIFDSAFRLGRSPNGAFSPSRICWPRWDTFLSFQLSSTDERTAPSL